MRFGEPGERIVKRPRVYFNLDGRDFMDLISLDYIANIEISM